MKTDFSQLRKFFVPEFIFGPGALNLTGQYVKRFKAKKVFIVTDEGLIKAGWLKKIISVFKKEKISFFVFDKVKPNPTDLTVEDGVKLLKKENCDILVALGGGSPMDCAKAIGIAFTNNKPVIKFEGVDEVKIPGLPLICIPTTAGTSADISQFAIITDTSKKRKFAIVSKKAVPDVALIDTSTTLTMSEELTIQTGMDALVHAFEAYVSNASSTITDYHALKAIEIIILNLPMVIKHPKNILYRNNMMLGSLFAGFAFSNAGLGLVHSMAHSLGGSLNLPHGECNSLLLETAIKFNFDSVPEKYTDIAKIFGLQNTSIKKTLIRDFLIARIKDFKQKIGIDYSLKNIGVKLSNLDILSKIAINDACLATNPKQVTLKDIRMCYEEAF